MPRPFIRRLSRLIAAVAAVAALVVYSGARMTAQTGSITITGCVSSTCVVKAGPDFATDAFADPWDFTNREDVALDPAQVTVSNFSVSGGFVSGTAGNSSGHFAVLEQPWPGIIGNPGKTGLKFPLNPGQYTKLAVKINAGDGLRHPRVFWSHGDLATGGSFAMFDTVSTTPAGNNIMVLDLSQNGAWTTGGSIEGLGFYPNDLASAFNFSFDWVRLTTSDSNSASALMTFSWTGAGGTVDVTVTDAAQTTYTIKKGVSGSGSLTWNYGILPPGTYTLKVGTLSRAFTINAPPLIQITDPDQTGGADFATDVLQNPWDMNDANDVFHNVNIVPHVLNESFTNGIYNAMSDGATVAFAGSVPVGDPQVYLLSNQKTSNTTDIIDTTKYHRLTFDMSIDHVYDVANGSVMRVFWGSASSDSTPGGTPYQVTTTKDILAFSPGKYSYTIDLAKLTTANGGLEATSFTTPWSQQPVRHFRIDPFEFAQQITFHMDNVKLAADDETSNNKFTIKWTGSDADPLDAPVVALYYQPIAGGAATLIAANVPLSAGQYQWDTTSVPKGTYNIIAVASDGINQSAPQFSSGPVKVSTFAPASHPYLFVDTPVPNQTLTSAFEVGGWVADTAAPTGSGIDDIEFYVQVPGAPAPGVFIGHGRLGLPRGDVAAVLGSQFANCGYHFTITGMSPGSNFILWVMAHSTVTNAYTVTKTVPFNVTSNGLMSIDIPSAEQTISAGTFGVSGWAIDRRVETQNPAGSNTGIDMVHVYAYHNPGSGEPPIFLGIAQYGQIQRPDVAAAYGARYVNSGYWLTIDRAAMGLFPGTWNIVVWAHNSVTNAFESTALVQVILQ